MSDRRRTSDVGCRGGVGLAAGLIVAAVAACGAAPERHYFTLSYPVQADTAAEARPPLHPVRLRVKPFQVALPYDRTQIVYRQSPYEFQFYTFRFWSAKPQNMLREVVEAQLEASRLVLDVSREFGDHLPDYELGAEIQALEESDSGDAWFGHLAIRFELVRFSDKVVVWHYAFDRQRRVEHKAEVFVAQALSRILETEMARVVAELDGVLSRERGVPPTLVLPPAAADDKAPIEPVVPPDAPPAAKR